MKFEFKSVKFFSFVYTIFLQVSHFQIHTFEGDFLGVTWLVTMLNTKISGIENRQLQKRERTGKEFDCFPFLRMKDQLNLRVLPRVEVFRGRKWQNGSSSNITYNIVFNVCTDWVDKPQNYKDLYRILQLLWGSHLNNFPLKTLKLGCIAFHSVTFRLNV